MDDPDSDNEFTPLQPSSKKSDPKQEKTVQDTDKLVKVVKAVVPHVALNCVLVMYLMLGAFMFQYIEQDADRQAQTAKGSRILGAYKQAEQAMLKLDPKIAQKTPNWKEKLYAELNRLSEAHELREFKTVRHDTDDQDPSTVLPARWTFLESTLYALSILTTTGYTYVSPQAMPGQVATVLYGLIGIPLSFLVAVDLGKFLSQFVLFLYKHAVKLVNYCGCSLTQKTKGSLNRPSVRQRASSASFKRNQQTNRKPLTSNTDSHRRRASLTKQKAESDAARRERESQLPLWVNASILLIFCCLGGGVYQLFDDKPTFMDAFFIAFNLLANLTMAEMKSDSVAAVIYITIFVTFGLAVLTMCADLAATELKWLFMKIHYFGRKIGRRRRAKISDDVAAMLQIIQRIRHKYPEKHHITKEDIVEFIAVERIAAARIKTRPARCVIKMSQSADAVPKEQLRRGTHHFEHSMFADMQFVDDVMIESTDTNHTQLAD